MAESKTTLLNVKVSKTELTTITSVAADQNMNRSEFVREAIYAKLHEHFTNKNRKNKTAPITGKE